VQQQHRVDFGARVDCGSAVLRMIYSFIAGVTSSPQIALYLHNRFHTLFFSMKMTESRKIVLLSCIIDLNDIQVCSRLFSLILDTIGERQWRTAAVRRTRGCAIRRERRYPHIIMITSMAL
jgi:hypothetical protein